MGNHIVELNGDCVALVINKGDAEGYQVKIMPGPECTFIAYEVWAAVKQALEAFADGKGERFEC